MIKKLLPLFLFATSLIAQTSTSIKNSTLGGSSILGGTGTAIALVSITISPSNPVVPFNGGQTFTASGTYSDGSTGDITGISSWFSSNTSVATNVGPSYQCIARGITTVSAIDSGVTGTTQLGCQSPTFTPQGTVTTTQSLSSMTIVQYTGGNGTSPFTFSASGLPSGWSLSSTGCPGGQNNCSLVGIPATIGVYNFFVQVTDNLGNTACSAPGCPVGVSVVSASAEDNIYCNSSEVVTGLTDYGPANVLNACNNTAIANTPISGSPTVIYVCPIGQLSNGVSVSGCANAPQPSGHTVPTCYTVGGVFCSTIQSAVNYVYNVSGCGSDIQIYPRIDDAAGHETSTINKYVEPPVTPPGNLNCGPDFGQPWTWIRTKQFANLPAPGNRVTPGWVNQTSIIARPNYAQPTIAGNYLPEWECEVNTQNGCEAFISQMSTATVGQIYSGFRVMGIFFAAPHGRDTRVDLYGNNVCPLNANGTPQCTPGWGGSLIGAGCYILSSLTCSTMNGSQGHPAALPTGSGSQHVIFDRILISGCDDITMLTCFDSAEALVQLQGGQHLSIIDSYVIDAFCMFAIGPCVESHGVDGGNVQQAINDNSIKIVDNYIEASGENIFWGGGQSTPGVLTTNLEVRRNHFWKPLTWKADNALFNGQVYDAFVTSASGAHGSGYSGATTCTMDPPLSGITAQCTPVIVGGTIADVFICPTAPCSSSSPAGTTYGLRIKSNGTTYVALPSLYFTDGGVTYSSCAQTFAGVVNTNGTAVTWVSDQRFIPGLANGGASPFVINGVNYTVASVTDKLDLVLTTSAGVQTNANYSDQLPSRGDCFKISVGIPDVKNNSEFKNGDFVLWEGNHHENVWEGASDQQGFGFLITPKNGNGGCVSCQVTDMIFRYNYLNSSTHGMQIAAAGATQGGGLSLYLTRLSIHDNVFDFMNGPYWTSGTAAISSGAGTCIQLENVNSEPYNTSFVLFDHNTCVATLGTGQPSLTGGAFLSLFYNDLGVSPAVMEDIEITNNIGSGGVKQTSSHNSGNINCLNNACTDQCVTTNSFCTHPHGPSEVSLRQALANDFMSPIVSGAYTQNQIFSINMLNNNTAATGTCSVAPTTVTLSGGGGSCAGSACTAKLVTAGTSPNIYIKQIWAVNVGQGYTSSPTATITGGTCGTTPTAQVTIVGTGILSGHAGCFDSNMMPTAGWTGVIPMIPYPTTQIDATHYHCLNSPTNINYAPVAWYPVTGFGTCGTSFGNASNVNFVNFALDSNCVELPYNDLHLSSTSPGHAAANDGSDVGANIDLVLGKSNGSAPSPYTGCTINAGVVTCPQ